jgi:hypothetical protein
LPGTGTQLLASPYAALTDPLKIRIPATTARARSAINRAYSVVSCPLRQNLRWAGKLFSFSRVSLKKRDKEWLGLSQRLCRMHARDLLTACTSID